MTAGWAELPGVGAQPELGVFPRPPAGWEELPIGDPFCDVMSNRDRSINESVAGMLRQGGCWARHAAWDFNGVVWFAGDRWHELVAVDHQARGAYSADTLEELMKVVNDEFGWA